MNEITKICRICKCEKNITEFPLRNKISRRHNCKKCHNKIYNNRSRDKGYTKEYRNKTKFFVYEYLTKHPCVDCGESNPVCLEFDHIKYVKKSNISVMIINRSSIKQLEKEIEKCEVRCANCHRKKTAKDFY
jgi:hypothetical protein